MIVNVFSLKRLTPLKYDSNIYIIGLVALLAKFGFVFPGKL